MTDPGSFSTLQLHEKNIDIILFTHEHGDHFHLASLQKVLENNPQAKIITNTAVGKLLDAANISYEILEHGNSTTEQDILIEGFGEIHDEIFGDFGRVQNTGYFIEDTFFYPGDALTNPGKPVSILAVPMAGPWIKVKDIITYLHAVKPIRIIPVHDAILSETGLGLFYRVVPGILAGMTEFIPMKEGSEHEF
jgi:L-ascorbate metabolism protein UlaG (beta-lactamase superfamily)